MLSESAFKDFYQQSAGDLRKYVVRISGTLSVADDIVQEAYLRLLRHPPPTQELGQLRAYLFRIATNLVTDQRRRFHREMRHDHESPMVGFDSDAGARIDMIRTFRQLHMRERQLMWLAYVEGHSHRDIASALNIRENSVRVLLSRARARLRGLLGEPLNRDKER